MPPQSSAQSLAGLKRVIERHWGYRTFRPLQEPAMRAVLDGRDSVVVLPTGGGSDRIIREAVSPSISGIITSIKTTS